MVSDVRMIINLGVESSSDREDFDAGKLSMVGDGGPEDRLPLAVADAVGEVCAAVAVVVLAVVVVEMEVFESLL